MMLFSLILKRLKLCHVHLAFYGPRAVSHEAAS